MNALKLEVLADACDSINNQEIIINQANDLINTQQKVQFSNYSKIKITVNYNETKSRNIRKCVGNPANDGCKIVIILTEVGTVLSKSKKVPVPVLA